MSDVNEIAEAIIVINECLIAVGKRLETIEKYISELPTPEKTFYKPKGHTDYLNVKGNYDEIYKRIEELENKINGM